MKPGLAWKIADGLMLLAFLFSVAVQYNDPDPVRWMVIYGLAAVGCVLGLMGRGHWAFPTTVAVVAVVWSATISPDVVGRVPFLDMFDAFEMKDLGVEESREMYGLLIVVGWMIVLAVRFWRSGRTPVEPA